ncbi:MAG: tetratricopeptide repeat protein [Bdellovibrionota bacterium]
MGEWAAAANAYDDVYKLDSKNVDWAFERGLAAENAGDANRAIAAFQDVVKLDARHTKAHAHLGKLFYDQKILPGKTISPHCD